MKHNEYISKYDVLIENFLTNKSLITKIYENVTFVKKYTGKVDSSFKDSTDRHIAYRELGSIIYSCIEAILKGVVQEIDKKCIKNNCTDSCSYRLDLNNLDFKGLNDILLHLTNARLVYFDEHDLEEFLKLADLRNYVHISKNITKLSNDDNFDREFVCKMFDYYYELIDQLTLLNEYYFKNDKQNCLKNADGNDYKRTKEMYIKSRKMLYTTKLHETIEKALLNKELTEDDKWYLYRLDSSKLVDFDEVSKIIKNVARYQCKEKSEYETIKKNLTKHLKHKATIDKINAI